MPRFRNPFSYEFSFTLDCFSVYFFLNENLYVKDAETFSVPHNHTECELRYFESGTTRYTVGSSEYICQAGDYLLVPAGVFHAQLDFESGRDDRAQFNLRFSVSEKSKGDEDSRRKAQTVNAYLGAPRFVHRDTRRLGQLLHLLAEEMYDRLPGYLITIKALCAALMVEILRPLGCGTQVFPDEKQKYSGYMRTAIDDFFTDRYLEPVTVHDLAREMKITVRQASRVIQNVYGMTFSRKLREMRLEAAKVLLRMTERSIADVAADCGFETYSYFFSAFKAHEKISPQAYRQRHGKTKM